MHMKTLLIAALAAATLTGAATQASAGHRHFHGHHHRLFFHVGPKYPLHECSFQRDMWYETGLLKWKRRYYVCMGWW